jgi:ubiquinone/menaquinone biosynthesis C-methylase UbiE
MNDKDEESNMKIRTIAVIILSIFMLSAYSSFLAAQTDPADAWEKRINELQPPDKVMDAIGVKPGMIIGEIGAGRGRYTVHLARRVGASGRIYANDIDSGSLTYLRNRCKREGLDNITTILGRMDDPLFPAASLDMVFMVNTYHHLASPVSLLRKLVPGLKPGAVAAIVEHDPDKGGSYRQEATSEATMRKQAAEAGYEVVRVETFLPTDNIYILRVLPTGTRN